MAKKIPELTSSEHDELFKEIGTADLPYPANRSALGDNGKPTEDLGAFKGDNGETLVIYSDQPYEHVVGTMYREMAIPSMAHIQTAGILRRNPDSKNRTITVLGDPGSGKSHEAKKMARVRDSRGGIEIDCGGKYLGDLLFEQVIDFGEDFKTALTERIELGALSKESTDIFDEEFPKALRKDSDGKVIGIDWEKIVQPKQIGTEEKPEYETTAEAVDRAMEIIEGSIAKWESIPAQAVNNLGIRKQPGPIIRAYKEGRELLLDEYTKSIEGSDDSLQSVLQFLTGESDKETVTSSMKVNGREETYEFTFDRKDMKPGFFVTITGNKEADGYSTHALSRSAYSRLDHFVIENSLDIDWKHRVSQKLTGLPLSTLHAFFSKLAVNDPDEFGQMMQELRLIGLTDEERENVPVHQMTMLRNWEETNAAIEKIAEYYMYYSRIIEPHSDLFDPSVPQNTDNIKDILPEISASFCDENSIDFRKILKDIDKAITVEPTVSEITADTDLRINFSAISNPRSHRKPKGAELTSSEFGTRLEAVAFERVSTMTKGRPKLQAQLIKEGRERGIFSDPSQPENQANVATLLNQDMFAEFGGAENVLNTQSILARRIRSQDLARKDKKNDELVPVDKAIEAIQKLERVAQNLQSDNPRIGHILLLGNSLEDPFMQVSAQDGFKGRKQVERPQPENLIKASDFIDALKIPKIAENNIKNIFRNTISSEALIPKRGKTKAIVEMAEGQHSSNISITTLLAQDDIGKAIPMHVIVDHDRKKHLIVTDKVDAETKAILGNNYTIVSHNDSDAEQQVTSFIKQTLQYGTRQANASELEEAMATAFVIRNAESKLKASLPHMMTKTHVKDFEWPVYLTNNLE